MVILRGSEKGVPDGRTGQRFSDAQKQQAIREVLAGGAGHLAIVEVSRIGSGHEQTPRFVRAEVVLVTCMINQNSLYSMRR
jgi:hypothetical protein